MIDESNKAALSLKKVVRVSSISSFTGTDNMSLIPVIDDATA